MNRPAIGFVVTFWIVCVSIVWLSQSAASVLLILFGVMAVAGITALVYGIGTAFFHR